MVAVLLSTCSVSRAGTLKFAISGLESGYFSLSSTPTPDFFNSDIDTIFIVSFTDSSGTAPLGFDFFNALDGGGFADDVDGEGYFGPQVYTGTESAPVFSPGVFHFTLAEGTTTVETLTITEAPEPSSLMLMFTGLAAGAFIAGRKRLALPGTGLV
jgi:hypothetical protein